MQFYINFDLVILNLLGDLKCQEVLFYFPFSEVVEHACGMATLQMGEYVSNVSSGIDTYSIREPLGVCAGICPFNFPAMIPLWVGQNDIDFLVEIQMHIMVQ